MKPEWIPIYLILGYLAFQFLLRLYYPLFVFIHELGHAFPAMLFRKQNIQVHIGEGEETLKFNGLGVAFVIHATHRQAGHTSYDGRPETKTQACFIVLTAPIISVAITLVLSGWIYHSAAHLHLFNLFALSAAWLANFHIAFSAWWPFNNPQSDFKAWIKMIGAKE